MKYLSVLFLFMLLFTTNASLQAQNEACNECYNQAESARWKCESYAQIRYFQARQICDDSYCDPNSLYAVGVHHLCIEYYYDSCIDAAEWSYDNDIYYCLEAYWDYIEWCETTVC